MKKIISAILLLSLVLVFTACAPKPAPAADFSIAALKGPTAMGLVSLMDGAEKGIYTDSYTVDIYGTADEIVPKLTKGELDVACIPANLAATLYNKTNGSVRICAVNTLGVLYVVENGAQISSVADLAGKTVYSTGKGTTPEYALRYILKQNGLDPDADLTIEYKSESSEIASLLAFADGEMIAVLPQPYVATVMAKNTGLAIALSLSDEWDKVAGGQSKLITGVVVARADFLEQNAEAFERFLSDYAASVDYSKTETVAAAALCEKYGIVAAAVAEKALPYCNLTFLSGEQMKTAVSGYLKTLYDSNPAAIGGQEVEDDFYYFPKG